METETPSVLNDHRRGEGEEGEEGGPEQEGKGLVGVGGARGRKEAQNRKVRVWWE